MNLVIFGIPIHFCADEMRMLMWGAVGALPVLGLGWAWVKSKFKKEVKAHHDCCHTKNDDPCKN